MESRSRNDTRGDVLTKWLPMSAIGAGITFVSGFLLHVPPPQLLVSSALTAGLIFSGMIMHSRGRGKRERAPLQ